MSASTELRPILTWTAYLEGAPIPGSIWAQLYALSRMARRHPGAIPALEVDTKEGSLVVMDPQDFKALVEGRTDVRDRR